MQRFSIRSLLVLLVLAVALPLAGLLVYITHLRVEARAEFVRELARGAADAARDTADNLIDGARELMVRLAPDECPGLNRERLPPGTTVAVVDPSGAVLCRAGSLAADGDVSLAQDPGFRRMSQARAFAIGNFAVSPLTGRWSVPLYYPKVDRSGAWVRAIVVALDHSRFNDVLRGTRQDFMDAVAVVARDGDTSRIVSASTDPGGAGRVLDSRPEFDAVREGRTDVIDLRGFDGRKRIGAVRKMSATGWTVYVGLDRDRVMASIYRQQATVATAFGAVVVGTLLFGFWLSHRIAGPIVALAKAAPSAIGAEGVRLFAVAGPKEVSELAARLGQAIQAHAVAESQAREIAAQAQAFLRYSPVVYVRCDTRWRIDVATDRWKALFAEPASGPEGREVGQFFPDETASWFRAQLRVATQERRSITHEHELPTLAGTRAFVSTFFPVPDAAGELIGVGALSLDVTELKTAERERERLNLILTRVTEAVPLCLSYIGADNRYVWTNARNGERLGHAPEWIVGRTAREVYGRQFQDISDGSILVRRGNSVREERAWRGAAGELRDYEHFLVPDLGPDGSFRGHTAMWLDITERKAAQEREHEYAERLQVLSRRLIDAQEAERRSVARELHDEVGQQLTAVLFMLRSLHGAASSPGAAARLEEGAELVNSAIDGVRNTSLRLRPAILDDLGLVPALRWLVEQQARLTDSEVTLELGNLSSDVPPQTATGCFRIVQEAITNAVRHARSRRVRVRLQEAAGGIEVEVEDDGVGFDLAAARKRASEGGSSGLTGMRERAELLGGTCWVHTLPGSGTKIRAAFPFAA